MSEKFSCSLLIERCAVVSRGRCGVESHRLLLTCENDLEHAGIQLLAHLVLTLAGQRSVVLVHYGRIVEDAARRTILVVPLLGQLKRLTRRIKFPSERPRRRISMHFAHHVQILTSICADNNNFIGYANGCIWKKSRKKERDGKFQLQLRCSEGKENFAT